MAKEEDGKITVQATHDTRPDAANVAFERLGPIQRQIRRAFIAKPLEEMRTVELVEWCYPRLQTSPTRHHRRSIVRAAEQVADRVRRDYPGGVVWRAKQSQVLPSADE